MPSDPRRGDLDFSNIRSILSFERSFGAPSDVKKPPEKWAVFLYIALGQIQAITLVVKFCPITQSVKFRCYYTTIA